MSLHISRGSSYEDRDGQIRNFTSIDWDKKTKVSTQEIDIEQVRKELRESRQDTIDDICSKDVMFAGREFQVFLIMDQDTNVVSWNRTMLEDPGLDLDYLNTIYNILRNREEIFNG